MGPSLRAMCEHRGCLLDGDELSVTSDGQIHHLCTRHLLIANATSLEHGASDRGDLDLVRERWSRRRSRALAGAAITSSMSWTLVRVALLTAVLTLAAAVLHAPVADRLLAGALAFIALAVAAGVASWLLGRRADQPLYPAPTS